MAHDIGLRPATDEERAHFFGAQNLPTPPAETLEHLYAITADGEHIGGLWMIPAQDAYWVIHRVAVDKAWRRQGVATAVLEIAGRLARYNGASALMVTPLVTDRGTLALNAKCGFTTVACLQVKPL